MTTAPRFSHGKMTVTIADADIDLLANVRAARAICRLYGGLTAAYRKLDEFDLDTTVTVINAAAGRVGKEAEATAEAVFAEGIVTVAPLAATFLNFLAAGGKVAKLAPEGNVPAGSEEAAPGEAS